jgi:8-oxo-dGTP diphosphatase
VTLRSRRFAKRERVIPVALLPQAVLTLLKEAARHVLKRPVLGIAAVATLVDEAGNSTGKIVLIKRADTQTWGLVGGTLEWGETLSECIRRELFEEAGVRLVRQGPLVGVYSRPERDPRFHGVTVVIRCDVCEETLRAQNPLEILEVKAFNPRELPSALAFGMEDALRAAALEAVPLCE